MATIYHCAECDNVFYVIGDSIGISDCIKKRRDLHSHTVHFLSSYGIKFLTDLLGGSRCQQRNNDNCQRGYDERRKQLVDVPDTAHGTNQILPYEYHHTACDHTGQSALHIGTLPEQREENQRSEGCAEACPCKGYDIEYGSCPDSMPGKSLQAMPITVRRAAIMEAFALILIFRKSCSRFWDTPEAAVRS